MKQLHIKIHGRVQNVGFRFGTVQKAREFGVMAIPRNDPDGSVAIDAIGEEPALNRFIEWCRIGTPSARVERMEIRT